MTYASFTQLLRVQYSINFSFFLHGESTVCSSLDIRQFPKVKVLNSRIFSLCLKSKQRVSVILSPYGISARLVVPSIGAKEPSNSQLDNWMRFYPIRSDGCDFNPLNFYLGPTGGNDFLTPTKSSPQQSTKNESGTKKSPNPSGSGEKLPKFVDVLLGGYRMRYPACFVLISEEVLESLLSDSGSRTSLASHASDSVPATSEHVSHPACQSLEPDVLGRFSNLSNVGKMSSHPRLPLTKLPSARRRRHLADRALRRALRSELSFLHSNSQSDRLENYLSYSHLPGLRSSRFFTPSSSTEHGLCEPNGRIGPISHLSCSPSVLPSSSVPTFLPLHRRAFNVSHATHSFLDELDSYCDKTRSPPLTNTDPMMPTLSPQQPAPGHQTGHNSMQSATVTTTATSNVLSDSSVFTPPTCYVSQPPINRGSSVPTNLPPCLLNPATPYVRGSPTLKPDEVERGSMGKPPPCLAKVSPPRSVPPLPSVPGTASVDDGAAFPSPRPLYNSWLVEQAVRAIQRGSCVTHKQPLISLSRVDKMNILDSSLSAPSDPLIPGLVKPPNDGVIRLLKPGLHDQATDAYTFKSEDSDTPGHCYPYASNPSSVLSAYGKDPDSGSIDGFPSSEEHLRELDEDYLKPETASQILMRTRARRLPPGRSLFSSSGSGHLDPSELALMFPTPPSHDTHQPSPTDISMLVAAASTTLSLPGMTNSNPCTPTASAAAASSQATDLNRTALTSPCNPTSTVNMETVGHVFPHLTKFLFDQSGLDGASAQDWAFLRPTAPHFHIPSMYKLSMEEFLIYRESLPHSQPTYDHRSLSSDQLNTFNLTPQSTTSVPSATTLSQTVASSPAKSHGSRIAACEPLDPLKPVGSALKSQLTYALEVSETREADPLKLVLILSDSLLSLFRDHNFDSCNICECTSSVFGSEMEIYLPNPRLPQPVPPESAVSLRTPLSAAPCSAFSLEDQLNPTFSVSRSCTCGFSAFVNRRYATSGNLFYEDQLEVSALSIARFFLADRVQITDPPCPRLPPPPPLAQPSAYSRNDGWWAGRTCPNATHMALLHRWTCGSLEEFGVRLLVDWLNHDDLTATSTSKENLFDYTDACALTASAIEQSVLDPHSLDSSMEVDRMSSEDLPLDEATREEGIAFHPAFFHRASAEIPANKNDQIRLLESVRPWLQEAISSTRLLESNYKVDGPLTWKAFHQLAGRGANESCKPQPIPPFLVGGPDKDSLLISPFGVRDWDCLALAPLSRPKRVAFAVVLPAILAGPFGNASSGGGGGATSTSESPVNAYTSPRPSPLPTTAPMSALANFFRELSYAYENCRLGQHYPYFNPVAGSPETSFIPVCSPQDETDPDIATVSSLAPMSADLRRRLLRRLQTHTPSPEHFLQHLQFYVATAIHTTVKLLAERGVALPDGRRSSLVFPAFSSSASFAAAAAAAPAEGPQQSRLRSTVAAAAVSAAPRSPMPIASKTSPASGEGPLTTAYEGPPVDSDINTSLLIYLVNPFTQFADMDEEFQRLTTQALVGAGTRILSLLPDSWRQRVSFQLLPMEHTTSDYLPRLKSMALSVYSFIDRFIEPSLINANRTLTGMGPAAEKEFISATGEHLHARRVYSPAYTLAQRPDLWGQWCLHPSEPLENSSVLFVSYCLSEDQQWLLAACTDEQGSMLEHTFINIKMPEFMRCAVPPPPTPATPAAPEAASSTHLSSRRLGLACLWDFIISILATTSNPWRLVIGRLGRLGHGELKGWSGLLSSKNLQDVNQSLRANCALCATATSVSTTSARHMYNGKTTTTISLVAGGGVNSCVHEIPSVLSACLVSIEPQSTFRLFPFSDLHMGESWLSSGGVGGASGFGAPGGSNSGAGGGGVGGGGGGNAGAAYGAVGMCPFNSGFVSASGYAPSTTHILVFPTSPSARAQSEHDVFSRLTDLNLTDELLDYSNGIYPGLDDQAMNQSILDFPDPGERNSSVVQLRADSATIAEPDITGLSYDAACRVLAKHYLSHALLPFGVPDPQLELPSLMQQPLAMGYYISTAPTGPMPAWFWSACRQTSQSNPVCLKSALHLHLSLVGNDDAVTTDTAVSSGVAGSADGGRGYAGHLLDSTVTCDVLRFVLESYNSLSWLTYDPVTNDRRSCLPFHILALAQLSQATRIFT
uniref:Mediator of RNA polymerase II transcription subunit 13 n=1 Tax=Schistocephalus solidus TaxID=70667 RepID=A0A0X3PKR7_SCHSO